MTAQALGNHALVLIAICAGIAGMGIIFKALSHHDPHALSFGIPLLFIGLWWAGRELGRSILASKARSAQ